MATPVDHYAVMGNPIRHSFSPWIHAAFAEAVDHRLNYAAREVPVNGFEDAVTDFFARGGHLGLSVTAPFKEEACQASQIMTKRAEKAGAVNTLWLDDKRRLNGDNTDGIGIVRDLLVNHGVELKGARVLIIGAGGAVRGVLEPLLKQCPSELLIANRTVSKAEKLVTLFPQHPVSASGLSDLVGSFDVIIHGTSAGLSGHLPAIPASVIKTLTCCYDMSYCAKTTPFNQWAMDHGAAQAIDGLGMLVEQAAEQFAIWRGVRPDTTVVFESLRRVMSHR